jgi:hypothetical protein
MTNQKTPRTAAEIAALLNAYEAEHTDPTESNLWDDVIVRLPEYDAAATADEDPTGRSDVVVLRDDSTIRYRPERAAWVAEA